MDKKAMLRGYVYIIVSAAIFGTMPLMASLIYARGVTPLTLVFLRNLLSLPVVGILARRQHGSLRIPAKTALRVGGIGLMGCCITPVLLFCSYQFIPSGTSTVFHFIYPAVVALLGLLVSRGKGRFRELVPVGICVVGIGLFYNPGQPLDLTGTILALSSGVTYAIYILLLSAFRDNQVKGFLFLFWAILACSLVMIPVCLLGGGICLPTTLAGWLLCLLFAVAVNAVSVSLFQRGTFLIGGQRASVLSTLEPITGVLLGAAFLQEPLGLRTGLGTVLVVLAGILLAAADAKKAE